MPKAKKKSHGAGLAIASIAALAGAYYLYGSKNATKNRKAAKSWMLKMKGEVLEKIERARSLEAADYEKIVDTVSAKYAKMKSVNNAELSGLAKDLKKHWKEINKETKSRAKKK